MTPGPRMTIRTPQHPAAIDTALLPRDPQTGEPLPPRSDPGYYPGYSTLSQSAYWDKTTRDLIARRVADPPPRRFFTAAQWQFWTAVFAHIIPQNDRTPDRQIPIVPFLDERLFLNRTAGYRFEDMPQDRDAYILAIDAINAECRSRFAANFHNLPHLQRDVVLEGVANQKPANKSAFRNLPVHRLWQLLVGDACDIYYAHPFAWDEIGFGGPAYPRAYTRLERGEPEPWEVEEQRYDWIAPSMSVSDAAQAVDAEDQHQSHHGSGGTH